MKLAITGDEHADAVLNSEPFAVLLGMLLDQQYPMDHVFTFGGRRFSGVMCA